jgi:hypothetical protein
MKCLCPLQAARETADLIKKQGEMNKFRTSSNLRSSNRKMMPMMDKRAGYGCVFHLFPPLLSRSEPLI